MKQRPKGFMYEVEVSDHNHGEEFALELFEMMEDTTHATPIKKISSIDELVEWNEEV